MEDKSYLDQVIIGKTTLAAGMKSGEVKVAGDPADVGRFTGFFDLQQDVINLTIR